MRPSIIHSLVIINGMKNGEGLALCGGKFPGWVFSSFVDEVTCPSCKLEWYKQNKHRMKNHPNVGGPIIHHNVQLYNDTWIAACGELDAEQYHILSSKLPEEVSCNICLEILLEKIKKIFEVDE